ncbi:hypothetical protein [Parahaliea mediterranea]|uniref:Uncharacterized protein n=1 Tax=Parahaliea mediterranea TaxID=651086 RepID=A0A939DHL4_9GAMM|nr:hypothetical protein [Parahaliea mediterranea]MBN7798413.1 hypothetical protein [Parahaliea mediterranea]
MTDYNEFIEECDLAISLFCDGDVVQAVSERSAEELYEFAQTMALIARYHFVPSVGANRNFSFVANSSLSGGPHPCSYPDCRITKLEGLLSFAVLYADEVYIQNPFEEVYLAGASKIGDYARGEILTGILKYQFLRPLFEKGIIRYAQNEVRLCEHHSQTLAQPLLDEIDRKQELLFKLLEDFYLERCRVYFDVGEGAGPYLHVMGPTDVVDHGSVYFHLKGMLPEFLENLLNKKLPYEFSKREVVSEGLLSFIISPILEDLGRQEWHSTFFKTSYLCDNPMQMQIASKMNASAKTANSQAFNTAFHHAIPSVFSKDLDYLLRLRERENEAFSVYRSSLYSMLNDSRNWEVAEISEAFRDQVLPEINQINKRIADWKYKTRDALKEKVIFGSGTVAVGLYSGVLPHNIGEIIAALGGASALVGAAMDFNRTLKKPLVARESDLYFLWQASQ